MAGGAFVSEIKRKRIIKMNDETTLTQYEIAAALRVSQTTVSRVLRDYRNVKIRPDVDRSSTS